MKYIKIIILLLFCYSAKSQAPAPAGLPAPYSTGYYRIGWLQNDSGSITANRVPNFTPRFYGTEITYVNPGIDTSKWLWIGRWVKELKTGDITPTIWGSIGGTLSNQTDLQNALNGKLGNITNYVIAGSNITLGGLGTLASPYIINSTAGGTGTVTNFSFTNGNGLTGIVTNPNSTPSLALGTSLSGIINGNGTGFGTVSIGSGLNYSGGVLSATGGTSLSGLVSANGSAFTTATIGAGLSFSGNTLTNTINNTNQLTNGSGFLTNITSLINAGTNVTITGSGTSGSPYVINSSGSGSGTVTTFSSGNLSPLFTTSVSNPNTIPALSFSLSNAAANSVFGNNTGSSAAPVFYVPTSTTLNGWFGGNIQPQLNGTGFVKAAGTTISYDNSTYITGNQTISFAPVGDVQGSTTGTTSLTPTLVIQPNAVTTAKINNNAVTFAKMQPSTPNYLAGWDGSGNFTAIKPDTLFLNNVGAAGLSLAFLGGTDTLSIKKLVQGTNITLTQNADSSITISSSGGGTPGGSNTQVQFNNSGAFGGSANLTWNGTILTANAMAISALANSGGNDSIVTWDPVSKALRMRYGIINLKAANGLFAPTTDSLILGGPFNQNTTLNTAGFSLSITNLGHKTPGGTDSTLIEDAAGKIWKAPYTSGTDSSDIAGYGIMKTIAGPTRTYKSDTTGTANSLKKAFLPLYPESAKTIFQNNNSVTFTGGGRVNYDSLTFVSSLLLSPGTSGATGVFYTGDSFTFGLQASPITKAYPYLLSGYMGINTIDSGVSSTTFPAIGGMVARNIIYPNPYIVSIMGGFNNFRNTNITTIANRPTLQMCLQSYKFDFLKANCKAVQNATSGTGVTRPAGTWNTGYNCVTNANGITTTGAYTSSAGGSIQYIATDSTFIVFMEVPKTSSTNLTVSVDGSVIQTLNPSNQSDQSYGHYSIIITGLSNASHTILLTNVSGGLMIVDGFSSFIPSATALATFMWEVPKMNSTGYAGGQFSDAAADLFNAALDSMALTLPAGYPNYIIKSNSTFNVHTGVAADSIHPSNVGHIQLEQAGINALNASSPMSDGTIFTRKNTAGTTVGYYGQTQGIQGRFPFINEIGLQTVINNNQNIAGDFTVQTALNNSFGWEGFGNFDIDSILSVNKTGKRVTIAGAFNTIGSASGIFIGNRTADTTKGYTIYTTADLLRLYDNFNGRDVLRIDSSMRMKLLNTPSNTAYNNLVPAATFEIGGNVQGRASHAPLKIAYGTLMATPEIGAIEVDSSASNHIYWTNKAGTRFQIDQQAAPNLYNADGALTGTRSLSGSGNTLNLGTSGSKLSGLNINSTGALIMTGGLYNSTQGSEILGQASTINNAITAASGTVANFSAYAFLAPTITSTNATITYTTPSTLYINDAPTMSTNSSASVLYALNVAAGRSHFGVGSSSYSAQFDGGVTFGGASYTNTAVINLPASTTLQVALLIPEGATPSSPVPGGIYSSSTDHDLHYSPSSIGNDYILPRTVKGSATLDFPSTAAGASSDLTITVTGASDGDVVSVGVPNGSTLSDGMFTAWCSATNTVTVRFSNNNLVTSLDPASGTFKVSVIK